MHQARGFTQPWHVQHMHVWTLKSRFGIRMLQHQERWLVRTGDACLCVAFSIYLLGDGLCMMRVGDDVLEVLG